MGAQSLGRALCCSLILALALATPPPAVAAAAVDNHYQALAAFTAISVPIAYDGNLVAGPDNVTYDISMVGPTAILDAFQPVVAANTLTLGFKLPVPQVSNDQVNYTIRSSSSLIPSPQPLQRTVTVQHPMTANSAPPHVTAQRCIRHEVHQARKLA